MDAAIAEQRLPSAWLTTAEGGAPVVLASRRQRLPEVVHLAVDGHPVEAGEGTRAAFLPTPFAFCLRCRVSYEQVRGSDFGKLASLATEGRSSATSVVSASVVRSLRRQPDLPGKARKLLAFADNRQDASLQAGHFNDFIGVTQLRGALYRAVRDEPDGLTHEIIEQRVTDALGLTLPDFARNPDARFTAERRAWQALRAVVGYRLYLDLERGWRVTMPNLEQTGLVRIDYLDLPEIAAGTTRTGAASASRGRLPPPGRAGRGARASVPLGVWGARPVPAAGQSVPLHRGEADTRRRPENDRRPSGGTGEVWIVDHGPWVR